MHRACTEEIGAQASPCLLQASAYALQASRLSQQNVAQASPCLLQAPAFVLQASRSYGKIKAQAPHPVWGFKNLKEGRCRGEAVANATAVRIEGSIVCKTCLQTGL